jgi:hypothetical protein
VVEWRRRVAVTGGRLDVEVSAPAEGDFVLTALMLTRVAPHIGHRPPLRVVAGQPLALGASITSPEPLASVAVHYRLAEEGVFAVARMGVVDKAGRSQVRRFRASIDVPTEATVFEYYVAATDARGTVTCWPAAGERGPRRVHAGSAAAGPPEIAHEPVKRARPGEPIEVRVEVRAAAPLARVTLLYRNVNQMQTHDRAEMVAVGTQLEDAGGAATGIYTATIPAEHVSIEWDVMYHVEAVDVLGNGAIFPGLAAGTPYVIVPVER